jgi:hypothetical protein
MATRPPSTAVAHPADESSGLAVKLLESRLEEVA